MPARKLYKIKNVSFGDILTFFNSLMLRHHLVSKNQNIIQNLSFYKIRQFSRRHYIVPFKANQENLKKSHQHPFLSSFQYPQHYLPYKQKPLNRVYVHRQQYLYL